MATIKAIFLVTFLLVAFCGTITMAAPPPPECVKDSDCRLNYFPPVTCNRTACIEGDCVCFDTPPRKLKSRV
ncbi:hypothetical protein ABFS82_12G088100 [Erythranthe guttata]